MNRERVAPSGPEASAPLFSAVLAVILAAMIVWPGSDFALDDAWIHLDYAKSLRSGDGWSYNPGDHEAGCSSPLWVLLLAVWPTTAEPVAGVLALGVLFHAVSAWAGAALALTLARRRASVQTPTPLRSIGWLGGALVATSPLQLHGVGSGMEVPLATALVLAGTWTIVEGRAASAAALGALGVWARPELAVWTLGLCAASWLLRARTEPAQRRAATLAALGALTAAGAWALWLLATVGTAFPNAFYIKGRGGSLDGLAYVGEQVAPWQPWLIGLGGVVLAAAALRRGLREGDALPAAITLSSCAAVLVVASTRPLHPGVQFFEARYFAPLLIALPVVVALGLGALSRRVAVAALIPVAVITGLQARDTALRVRAAAEDTRLLHRQPAAYVASELPADAVVAVEGAGAIRFFAPRTMTIVDLVGLNDHVGARLHHDREAKICHWIARGPTHAVVPAGWLAMLDAIFEVAVLAVFDDPEYTQVEPTGPMRVVVVRLDAVRTPGRCPRA
jgi:hypothetical protein